MFGFGKDVVKGFGAGMYGPGLGQGLTGIGMTALLGSLLYSWWQNKNKPKSLPPGMRRAEELPYEAKPPRVLDGNGKDKIEDVNLANDRKKISQRNNNVGYADGDIFNFIKEPGDNFLDKI